MKYYIMKKLSKSVCPQLQTTYVSGIRKKSGVQPINRGVQDHPRHTDGEQKAAGTESCKVILRILFLHGLSTFDKLGVVTPMQMTRRSKNTLGSKLVGLITKALNYICWGKEAYC